MDDSRGQRLLGKHALVTGGASGFGEGIVRRFVAEGAVVAIVDLQLRKAEALAQALGEPAFALQADVSVEQSVREMAAALLSKLGRVDIVVNNAGIGQRPAPLEDQDAEQFDRIFATNARSVFLTARAFVPAMKRVRSGVI